MDCPECGEFIPDGQGLSACDCGEPDMIEGARCPHCGVCIPDDEWQGEDATTAIKLADFDGGVIATREQVARLPLVGVTEVDCAGAKIYGVSALDELMQRTQGATFTNMDDWTREQYEWVLNARK